MHLPQVEEGSIMSIKKIIVCLLLLCYLITSFAMPVSADDTISPANLSMPFSIIIGETMSAHEEDIKDRIFEYRLQKAANDISKQNDLLMQRSEDLRKSATEKERLVNALIRESDNGNLSIEQFSTAFNETIASLDKISISTKKLEESMGKMQSSSSSAFYASDINIKANIEKTKFIVENVSNMASNHLIKNKNKNIRIKKIPTIVPPIKDNSGHNGPDK